MASPEKVPLLGRPMSWLLLFVLLSLVRPGLPACGFKLMVNRFDDLGGGRELFFKQEALKEKSEIFKELGDSAIDPDDKNAHYLAFPYYLKVTLVCAGQDPVQAIRKAHYTGLIPIVTVAFEEPVHPVRQKPELLEIEMKAAPYIIGNCDSEELCDMCWFTPMPIMNGSVVMTVSARGNNLGMPVGRKRMYMNINGYVRETPSGPEFSIGERVPSIRGYFSLQESSRPMWFTYKQAPVHILGGITFNKVILLSDTGFEDFFPIELAIDSCWISSQKCPWQSFSSSIYDAIATESTLFVRQNQLVYYFTGSYKALYMNTSGSELWTRILAKQCIRQLNPVNLPVNNTEYVIALGGGWQEGQFYLISVSDGIVKHAASSKKSACSVMGGSCLLKWVVYAPELHHFYLLVRLQDNISYCVMVYHQDTEHYEVLSYIPRFVPESNDQGFVVMIGSEKYTTVPMEPRGIAYNPTSLIFFIWGNMILQSNDLKNYLYLSNFPSTSPIKYFVLSYTGEYACVTDNEEVWISHEGSSIIRRLYPSKGWNLHNSLQMMSGSPRYSLREALVTVFYDGHNLLELVYLEDARGNGKVVKREYPQRFVLTYSHALEYPQQAFSHEGKEYIKFSHTCPFGKVRIVDLPPPQRYTRKEYYRAEPPDTMEKTGFHNKQTLTVYQGLIFQLLWLHSAYNRPYADPVHDPTWRWWKNKMEDAQYYSYLASNRNSSGGVYVNMANYVKVYRIIASNALPEMIYLDKKNAYNFSVFFSIRTKKESLGESPEENSPSYVWLTIIVAHPDYVNVFMDRRELISRGAVLYKVTVMDIGVYPQQDLSGKKLLNSAMIFSVANAVTRCYDFVSAGPSVKGYRVLPVIIGCPPGRRLAFDVTGTLEYSLRKNKRYFDCVNPDPEMPCFFFSDVFYPSFLIQDMVTGDSGPFKGSYIFKIIGGGPYSKTNIRYFSPDEILKYNTNNISETSGHIWLRDDSAEQQINNEGFFILSGSESGIVWVCQEHSPCYDIMPRDLLAPEYFFVIRVTNRGVDQTTYCDYALEFIIHIHGLRLSPTRAIFLMKVSMSSVVGLVILYIVIYIVSPKIRAFCSKMFKRMKDKVVHSDSSFSSSATSSQNIFMTFSEGSTEAGEMPVHYQPSQFYPYYQRSRASHASHSSQHHHHRQPSR